MPLFPWPDSGCLPRVDPDMLGNRSAWVDKKNKLNGRRDTKTQKRDNYRRLENGIEFPFRSKFTFY